MTQWQPIDTLPKDWKRILIYGVRFDELYGEDQQPDIWLCDDPIGNGQFSVAGTSGYSADVFNPTHWMPLPPPPAAIEKGD